MHHWISESDDGNYLLFLEAADFCIILFFMFYEHYLKWKPGRTEAYRRHYYIN
jgi:hypothetical protein